MCVPPRLPRPAGSEFNAYIMYPELLAVCYRHIHCRGSELKTACGLHAAHLQQMRLCRMWYLTNSHVPSTAQHQPLGLVTASYEACVGHTCAVKHTASHGRPWAAACCCKRASRSCFAQDRLPRCTVIGHVEQPCSSQCLTHAQRWPSACSQGRKAADAAMCGPASRQLSGT